MNLDAPPFLNEVGARHFQNLAVLLGDDFDKARLFAVAMLAYVASQPPRFPRARTSQNTMGWFAACFPYWHRNQFAAREYLDTGKLFLISNPTLGGIQNEQ